jgi:hypothetical protein
LADCRNKARVRASYFHAWIASTRYALSAQEASLSHHRV